MSVLPRHLGEFCSFVVALVSLLPTRHQEAKALSQVPRKRPSSNRDLGQGGSQYATWVVVKHSLSGGEVEGAFDHGGSIDSEVHCSRAAPRARVPWRLMILELSQRGRRALAVVCPCGDLQGRVMPIEKWAQGQ